MSETTQIITPDGDLIELEVDWAVRGRGMPPIRYRVDPIPGEAGGELRYVEHGVKEIELPLWLIDGNEVDLRNKLRDLIAKLDPTRGLSTLRVTGPDGGVREIVGFVSGGLTMDEVLGSSSGPDMERELVIFTAPDPYWHDRDHTVVSFTEIVTAGSFFPFTFPFTLSATATWSEATVTNLGDVGIAPVWTITGPWPNGDLIVVNETTGRTLTLTYPVGPGETVTIDTRVGYRSVERNDGANLLPYLSGSMWPLERGTTQISIDGTGFTADSRVQLTYKNRYLTP